VSLLRQHQARKARLAFIREARARATDVALVSPWHADEHWRDVATTGLMLIGSGVDADPDVMLAFAAVHDTQRWNDYDDPEHGARAAQAVADLVEDGWLDYMTDEQVTVLQAAVQVHTEAPGGLDGIGAYLDADRLQHWRVGRPPKARYLSTEAAVDLIPSAWKLSRGTDYSWRDLVRGYVRVAGIS
jgi:uncharacterized protein